MIQFISGHHNSLVTEPAGLKIVAYVPNSKLEFILLVQYLNYHFLMSTNKIDWELTGLNNHSVRVT